MSMYFASKRNSVNYRRVASLIQVFTFYLLQSWLFVLVAAQIDTKKVLGDAQSTAKGYQTPRGTLRTDIKSIIICGSLILFGLFYCFLGFRLFIPTMFLTGFFFFSNTALVALNIIKPLNQCDEKTRNIYFLIVLVIGFIGGGLLVCYFNWGIFLIGVIGGFALFQVVSTALALSQTWALALTLAICVILGIVAINMLEKLVVVGATSLMGGITTVIGIDVVLNQGFAYDTMRRLNGERVEFSGNSGWECLGALVLAAIGFLYQYNVAGDGVFGGSRRK